MPWISNIDEIKAREVLTRLGFTCESVFLSRRHGRDDAYMHSIWDSAGRLRWASVHADIFQSMAITATIEMLTKPKQ
jgi:hypothetical protein